MSERISRISEHRRKILFSVNPNAGKSDVSAKIEQTTQILKASNFECEIHYDLETLEKTALAYDSADQLRTIVSVGGDGTISLLAERFSPRIPLTIFPAGTENLLAKYLNIAGDPKSIADLISGGWHCFLDAGKANEKTFLVMASCGFDADVVQRLHRNRKGRIRHLSWAGPILGAVGNYQYPKLRYKIDDQDWATSRWLFVFNVPRYAMQLPIIDDANPLDGSLDLCSFRGGNLFNAVRYLLGVVTRQHRKWQDTEFKSVRRIRIESKSENVPYQLDGDPGGMLPVDIEVLPRHLNVVVSPDWISQQGMQRPEN